MWFVYLLECKRGLYCGMTNDLDARIKKHNSGTGSKSVVALGIPCKLVYYEIFETKSDALVRESQIKKLSRKDKLLLITA